MKTCHIVQVLRDRTDVVLDVTPAGFRWGNHGEHGAVGHGRHRHPLALPFKDPDAAVATARYHLPRATAAGLVFALSCDCLYSDKHEREAVGERMHLIDCPNIFAPREWLHSCAICGSRAGRIEVPEHVTTVAEYFDWRSEVTR